jgi:Leucine-rich repeat (LRR) protein
MYQMKVLFMLLIACWSCSMTVLGIATPKGALRNHITGGFKGSRTRNSGSNLDCNQFSSDYDVLYHFSFLIMINPINSEWQKSTAYMDEDSTFVTRLDLYNEEAVPLAIFCLTNLQSLDIQNTPFPNGAVPDSLENLRQLRYLYIYNTPIVNMTERLGTMSNLNTLFLPNCSLTYLPNLSGISQLSSVYLHQNRLSNLNGLTNVYDLYLSDNLFTDIPTLSSPKSLVYLYMDNNPLKNMLTITSHVNLWTLYLRNTTLSSVPPTIDKLQKLEYLDLSYNKLFFLPTNIQNLPKLRQLNIQNNSFSLSAIQTFKTQFNTSHPNMTLVS